MRTLSHFVLISLLFIALPARAAEPGVTLKLLAEVRAPPATIFEVRAQTTSKAVKWVALTPGLSLRPIDGGRVLLVSGPAGRYELLAYTALGDVPSDPARCVVVIGQPPGPKPNPPEPPQPPADPLRAKLKATFDSDSAPAAAKREQAKDLAALYRAAAKLAQNSATSTSGELLARVREAARTLVGPDALKDVRHVVGVCSDQGFRMERDATGRCRPQGTWAHCMALVAVRGAPNEGGFLLNSWGDSAHTGPVWPDDAPKAGFWADAAVLDRMLRQGDSFALADVAGFPQRKLDWFVHSEPARGRFDHFALLKSEVPLSW